jgi:hypothetical protein
VKDLIGEEESIFFIKRLHLMEVGYGKKQGKKWIAPAENRAQKFRIRMLNRETKLENYSFGKGILVEKFLSRQCLKQAHRKGLQEKVTFVSFHVNLEEMNGCGPGIIKDRCLVADTFRNMQNDKNNLFLGRNFAK